MRSVNVNFFASFSGIMVFYLLSAFVWVAKRLFDKKMCYDCQWDNNMVISYFQARCFLLNITVLFFQYFIYIFVKNLNNFYVVEPNFKLLTHLSSAINSAHMNKYLEMKRQPSGKTTCSEQNIRWNRYMEDTYNFKISLRKKLATNTVEVTENKSIV